MTTPKVTINRSADMLRDRQAGLLGQLAKRLQLLVGQVVVDALHAPIIHTFHWNATAVGLAFMALGAAPAFGQEVAVPDKPVQVAVTSYRIVALAQTFEPDVRFVITYVDNTGRLYTDEHAGPSQLPSPMSPGETIANPDGADAFLRQMNTGNFTSISIVKRLLQHLVQHGKIPPSTVQGAPEQAAAAEKAVRQ